MAKNSGRIKDQDVDDTDPTNTRKFSQKTNETSITRILNSQMQTKQIHWKGAVTIEKRYYTHKPLKVLRICTLYRGFEEWIVRLKIASKNSQFSRHNKHALLLVLNGNISVVQYTVRCVVVESYEPFVKGSTLSPVKSRTSSCSRSFVNDT
jgi:hypothetical protein